nr:hypothetical protein [Tanacetum cinerariifolium]
MPRDPCEKVSSNRKSGKSQVGLGQHHMGVLGKGMGTVLVGWGVWESAMGVMVFWRESGLRVVRAGVGVWGIG